MTGNKLNTETILNVLIVLCTFFNWLVFIYMFLCSYYIYFIFYLCEICICISKKKFSLW